MSTTSSKPLTSHCPNARFVTEEDKDKEAGRANHRLEKNPGKAIRTPILPPSFLPSFLPGFSSRVRTNEKLIFSPRGPAPVRRACVCDLDGGGEADAGQDRSVPHLLQVLPEGVGLAAALAGSCEGSRLMFLLNRSPARAQATQQRPPVLRREYRPTRMRVSRVASAAAGRGPIWAALNREVMIDDEVWSSAGMKGQGKRDIPEKTRRPAESSGTIPTYENQGVTRPGSETGSHWCEASRLTAQPPPWLGGGGGIFRGISKIDAKTSSENPPKRTEFAKLEKNRSLGRVPPQEQGERRRGSGVSSARTGPPDDGPAAMNHGRPVFEARSAIDLHLIDVPGRPWRQFVGALGLSLPPTQELRCGGVIVRERAPSTASTGECRVGRRR
ncbi:hypothetical protein PR048_028765 [Dryococelus australis]|uniref:Uncharacterized protein n=1 Tax=Dryococelus australis TaxID=614101 RepID=A0ABQ9GE44_9NEOP|nr:hypothetical protein PR048_028765 [Dryococelus australis]